MGVTMALARIIAKKSNGSSSLRVKTKRLCWSAAIAFATLIGRSPAVQAANFNFTYAPGTSLQQMLGFEMAGLLWSDNLADNATLNIFVEMTNQLPENVIGGALPGVAPQQTYSGFYNSLSADITSTDDQLAFNGLTNVQGSQGVRVRVNNYEIEQNAFINVTRANAKALGMIPGGESHLLDGYILMNDLTNESVAWNYNLQDSAVPTGTLDYLSVALHEIGHTLGFISGVDRPEWLNKWIGKINYL